MDIRKNFYTVAYVFQIISTILNVRIIPFFWGLILSLDLSLIWWIIFVFIYLIPLVWMIPMTLMTKKVIDEITIKSHIGLGICTLLFQSFIAGILILIASNLKIELSNQDEMIIQSKKII